MYSFRKWFLLFAAIVLGGVFCIYFIWPVSRAMITAHPHRKPLINTPEDWHLQYQDISFETEDNYRLNGWFIPSSNGALVIIAHGYDGNRGDCLEQASVLVKEGYGVLLFDLLAHGQSEGNILSLNGRDVLAAVGFLKQNQESQSLAIGVWGFSLGAMSEIQAAAQMTSIQGIVADGPFPVVSIDDMPKPETLEDWFWKPFDLVEYKAWDLQGVRGAMNMPEALAHIAPRPILLISGTQNRGEARMMRAYYSYAGQKVSLWEVSEAGHIGSWSARKLEYEARVVAFFKKVLLKEK